MLVDGSRWLLQGGMGKTEGQELESGETSVFPQLSQLAVDGRV